MGGATEGREALQRDHDKLEGWAITNHIKFTMSKCYIRHLGQGNPGYTHRLGDKKLESNPSKKDVGVLPDGKSNQCALAAQRANRTLRGTRPSAAMCKGRGCPALLCAGAASHPALGAGLGATV